jgi:hypothetical protein
MTEQMTLLRRCMLDDMAPRKMAPLTQQAHVGAVKFRGSRLRSSRTRVDAEKTLPTKA